MSLQLSGVIKVTIGYTIQKESDQHIRTDFHGQSSEFKSASYWVKCMEKIGCVAYGVEKGAQGGSFGGSDWSLRTKNFI